MVASKTLIVALLILFCPALIFAQAQIGNSSCNDNGGAGVTSVSTSLTGTVSGELFAVSGSTTTVGSTMTPTDTFSDTYTSRVALTNYGGGAFIQQSWTAPSGSGGNVTFTVTFSGTSRFACIAVIPIKNVAASPFDVANNGSGGSSPVSVSVTTTTIDYLVGFSGAFTSTPGYSAGGCCTLLTSAGGAGAIAGEGEGNRGGVAAGVNAVSIAASNTGGTMSLQVLAIKTLQTADFDISISPASVSVQEPGTGGAITTTVSAYFGYTGTVSFSCSGQPTNTSCGFSPATVVNSGNTTLTLTLAGGDPTGTYPITVIATDGTLTHTGTETLTITFPAGTLQALTCTFTDDYGGCGGQGTSFSKPNVNTYTVSAVARAGTTETITLSVAASPAILESQPIIITGTTPDGGSFNMAQPSTSSTHVCRVHVVDSTHIQCTQAGNAVGTTASIGTVTEVSMYEGVLAANKTHYVFTPLGNPMKLITFQTSTDTGTSFGSKYTTGTYGSNATLNFDISLTKRMAAWGFNTIGQYLAGAESCMNTNYVNISGCPWGTTDSTIPTKLPAKISFKYALEAVASAVGDGYDTTLVKEFAPSVKESLGGIPSHAGNILGSVDMFDAHFTTITNAFGAVKCAFSTLPLYLDYVMSCVGDDEDDMGIQRSCESCGGQNFQSMGNGVLQAPPGNAGLHWGVVSLVSNPRQSVGTQTWQKMIRSDFLYPDTKFYTKYCMAAWLQADASGANGCTAILTKGSGTAARSSGVVTITFSTAHPFIPNEVVTVTGCSDATFNTVAGTGAVISDVQFHYPGAVNVTNKTLTYTLAGAGTSATGCTVTEGPGYASISALNTAWNSTYTGFGTSATNVTGEVLGTANSSTTSFAHTLAHHPDAGNTQVFVNSVEQGGSDAFGPLQKTSPTTVEGIRGCGMVYTTFNCNKNGVTTVSSTLDDSTGAGTFNFAVAPPTGQNPVANYSFGGWGNGGTGFLDEDGTHSWIPSDWSDLLTGATAAMKADLDHWYIVVSAQYHRVGRNATNGQVMFQGILTSGNFSVPAMKPFIQGAVPYLDFIGENTPVTGISTAGQTDQNREDFRTQAMLPYDRGITSWFGEMASQDNAASATSPQDVAFPTTESARATLYNTLITATFGMRSAVTQEYNRMEIAHWNVYDGDSPVVNWGFVTLTDNPYDGVCPASGSGGTETATGYACGSEPVPTLPGTRPFSNFVTGATTANNLWKTPSGAPSPGCIIGTGVLIGSGSIICDDLTVTYSTPNPLTFTFSTPPSTLNITVAGTIPTPAPSPFPISGTCVTPKSQKNKIWRCAYTVTSATQENCNCQ